MQPVSRPTDVEGEVSRHEIDHVSNPRSPAGEGQTIVQEAPAPKPYKSSPKLMLALLAGNLGIYFGFVILAHFGLISGSTVQHLRDYFTALAR